MYSFNPQPIIDTVNNHGGFWTVFCILAIITAFSFALAWDYDTNSEWKTFFIVGFISTIILGFTGCISWTTGSITVPKNEKVIADFAGFIAEGEAYTERSGKQTVRRENHYLYVAYNVPGYGKVIFPANKGTTYPEKAVLYKN